VFRLYRAVIPIFLVFLFSCSTGPVENLERSSFSDPYAVIQGFTDQTSAQFSVLAKKDEPITVYALIVSEDGRPMAERRQIKPTFSKIIKRDFSDWAIYQSAFTDLKRYEEYRLVIASDESDVKDERLFQTLSPRDKTITWVLASCMDDSFISLQKSMWQQVLSHEPDFLLFIGDSVYADKTSAGFKKQADIVQLWNRHVETRNLLEIFKAKHLKPIFATWDDHDFGLNDGGAEFQFKGESRKVFQAFFPQVSEYSKELTSGPGVSSRLRIAGQQFFLLDNRTFRSTKSESGTHFGGSQEEWVYEGLEEESSPAFLISGDQYFGGYSTFESYERLHPQSFGRFLSRLSQIKAPVFFLSGDRHLTELMKIERKQLGYETYEFTSSSIHAKVFPDSWKGMPNFRTIEGESGVYNYGLVESTVKSGKLQVRVRSIGPYGRIIFDRKLEVSK